MATRTQTALVAACILTTAINTASLVWFSLGRANAERTARHEQQGQAGTIFAERLVFTNGSGQPVMVAGLGGSDLLAERGYAYPEVLGSPHQVGVWMSSPLPMQEDQDHHPQVVARLFLEDHGASALRQQGPTRSTQEPGSPVLRDSLRHF